MGKGGSDWESMPLEVQDKIVALLPLGDLACKSFGCVLQRASSHQARALQHPDSFKDFHAVPGNMGLIVVTVAKAASENEKLYVVNPLTGDTRELPPLKFVRHLAILCLHSTLCSTKNGVTSSYWIIAIGGEESGPESPSRITQVYDSVRGTWEQAQNVPGPGISLQSGVFYESENLLLCVGFMKNGSIGILAFDVEALNWRTNWICPFLQLHPDLLFYAPKLVECRGRIYLFSEQAKSRREVTLCIDKLKLESGGGTWTREVTQKRRTSLNSRLLFYNEYTCVPVGKNKLCIFNRLEPDQPGEVYDMLESNPSSSRTDHRILPLDFRTLLESQACVFKPSFAVSANQFNLDVVDGVLADLPPVSLEGEPFYAEIEDGLLGPPLQGD